VTVAVTLIAFAGAVSAPRFRIIDPDSYGVLTSIFALACPIIGGMGSIWGGIVGGGVLRVLPELLRPVADYIELMFCALVVGTLTFFPTVRRLSGRPRGNAIVARFARRHAMLDARRAVLRTTAPGPISDRPSGVFADQWPPFQGALRAVDGVAHGRARSSRPDGAERSGQDDAVQHRVRFTRPTPVLSVRRPA
jgi:branched-chain amino acid transport system permease protein